MIHRLFSWLWRRWGQMFCFTVGVLMIGNSTQRYTDLAMIAYAIGGAAFLFTAIGLRATSFYRESKGARPEDQAPR